jgi:L-threonylcarbamoyladenylate synthase
MEALTAEPSVAAVVASGGLAIIPTDTVYGLCCDPCNAVAVERLSCLKGRPAGKPSALAFSSLEEALGALPEIGERTRTALRALLPGPLTLLVPNPARRFPLAGGELLGVRVIDLALGFDRPVLLTSANIAGGPDARTMAQVPAEIRAGAEAAVDRGELLGTPSTVVDLGALETSGRWRIVRQGACAAEAVERALVRSNNER